MRMFNSWLNLLWIFLQLFIFQFSPRVSAIRKDIGFLEKSICRNTVQGRYLLSDDNGRVCDALSMDPESGCCPGKAEKFSCHGCNLLSQCCNSYEFCVSCCLNPSRTQKEQVLKVKIAKQATAGTYAGVFDFCAGRCRHNSESVVHENAYLSDFHHCFSLPSNSSGASNTQLEGRLNGINVIVGSMQKYMTCKGACLASMGADQPAEVVDDAPTNMNPGACLFTRAQAMLSCDGSHPYTRRLCPCA